MRLLHVFFKSGHSPLASVVKVGLIVLVLEFTIMVAIEGLFIPIAGDWAPPFLWVVLDPLLLTVLVAPALYALVLHPMRRQQAELEHKRDELRITAIAFESQNGMLITDAQGSILRVNPAFTRITGYGLQDVVGKNPSFLASGRQDREFYREMWATLKVHGYWQGELWNKRSNGMEFAEMLTITAISDTQNEVTHYVGSFTDITAYKLAQAEIHHLAYFDTLTNLPNRKQLHDRLAALLQVGPPSAQWGAMFLIDLDNFKALNDTWGHHCGDTLLAEVARRLQIGVRDSDTVARQGGDEFVVLLSNLGDDEGAAAAMAKQIADQLRVALDRPFSLKGLEYHCRVSIGVDVFIAPDTGENLFKRADLALYRAKHEGRNTTRFFDPAMQLQLARRNALESGLRDALTLQQMQVFYQAQFNPANQVIGVEALLRWFHPVLGEVAPSTFIPVAEDTGLILPLGLWVLETACAQIKAWEATELTRDWQVAVNVSARQFWQADFAAQVQKVLDTTGANPKRLKLELTESLVLEDVAETIGKMHHIRQLGVEFSMDDFGTGHSSLAYLAQLPLSQLKIDRSFVSRIPGESADETISKTIINMGIGLSLRVIAEGVETMAQQDFLKNHGCAIFQGYLYGRPLPVNELMRQIWYQHQSQLQNP